MKETAEVIDWRQLDDEMLPFTGSQRWRTYVYILEKLPRAPTFTTSI